MNWCRKLKKLLICDNVNDIRQLEIELSEQLNTKTSLLMITHATQEGKQHIRTYLL